MVAETVGIGLEGCPTRKRCHLFGSGTIKYLLLELVSFDDHNSSRLTKLK